MRKYCLSLFSLVLMVMTAMMLTGCGPVYETTYTYQPPASWTGKRCVNECLFQKSRCQNHCQRDYEQCTFAAQDEARRAHRDYEREHRHDHDRHHHDNGGDYFVDTSQCTTSCGCDGDYNQCYSNCGGAVIPHTRCVAFCNKK